MPAVEPVKNVFIPSAASTPLVSPENANSMSVESAESCKRAGRRDAGR